MHVSLTIAGSDSGGGAGIQADLKTFEAHGVFGTSVITALTAQNTLGVQGVWPVPPEFVAAQMESVLSDFKVRSVKTGMLYNAETIQTVAKALEGRKLSLVVDPVMVATSGDSLIQDEALAALKEYLLPLASVITPNVPEAERLSGIEISTREDMEFAARIIGEFYPEAWVLLKGGHLEEEELVPDLLFKRDFYWLESLRIRSRNTHGTGCTLSAAIAANLAKRNAVFSAVKEAKTYVHGAILNAWRGVGEGSGSLRHNWRNGREAKP